MLPPMAGPAPDPDPTTPRSSPLPVAAWVLYDLANTVYIATVTFVFTPFAKQEIGGLTGHGVTNFLSMVAAAFLVPFLGALCDTTSHTNRYLRTATLLCIVALAGWALDFGSLWLLGCFLVANLTYNVALLFYNALLPAVAPPDRIGRVSGLGVGLGYLGTILVLVLLITVDLDARAFFVLSAGLFLALALPCLWLVHDRRRPPQPAAEAGSTFASANRRLLATLRELPRHRALMWFLVGNFCLVDVLNTAVLYFADFTVAVFRAQAEAGQLSLLGATFGADNDLAGFKGVTGLCLNVLALVYGVTIGAWTDRAPLAVMRASAVALLLALIGGAVFGGHSALGYLLTLVALGAFGLTGIWTAGRKIVVLLAPPDQVGRFFGLYGITVKLSVVGSVVYGVVSDAWGSKPAMLAQSAQLLLGLACLYMVRLPDRAR